MRDCSGIVDSRGLVIITKTSEERFKVAAKDGPGPLSTREPRETHHRRREGNPPERDPPKVRLEGVATHTPQGPSPTSREPSESREEGL